MPISDEVRFDELVLKVPGDELRVKFHPRMTVLSGLGAPEREALARSIAGALTGGADSTAMRYQDGTGRLVNVLAGPDGPVHTRHEDDGSPAAPPVSPAISPADLAALMLVQAADLGVASRPPRDDEPPELREARTSLEEMTAQLEEVLAEEQSAAVVRAELVALDEQLRLVRDGAARRQYAEVLAQLERVRSEAATLQSGTAGVDADRHLLSNAGTARQLAERWQVAADALTGAIQRFGDEERLGGEERALAARLPLAAPDDLIALVDAAVEAEATRAALDNRLQALAVSKLPAPSDPLVADLGLLDQDDLWRAADRLIAAVDELHRVQVSLGGLGGAEGGPPPAVIERMEVAHADREDAEQAAEAVRVPGVAGTGLGVAIALAGSIGSPLLIPIGLLIAAGVGTFTLARPRARVIKAAAVERAALEEAGVPSYLGFHLRRVDATVDPNVRVTVEAAAKEHGAATVAWVSLVGSGIDVHAAKPLEHEVREYHTALRNLGGGRRRDPAAAHRPRRARAEPAVAAARAALAQACAPLRPHRRRRR